MRTGDLSLKRVDRIIKSMVNPHRTGNISLGKKNWSLTEKAECGATENCCFQLRK